MESPKFKVTHADWCIKPACVVDVVYITTLTHRCQLSKYSIRMSPTVRIAVTQSTIWEHSLVMVVVLAGDIADTGILVEVAPDMSSVNSE